MENIELVIETANVTEESNDKNTMTVHKGIAASEGINNLYEKANLNSIDKIMEFDETIERRAIMVEGIDECTGVILENFIRFWNRIDDQNNTPIGEREPIKVYINSPGGMLTSTFTAVDAMQGSITPVYTINVGCAYSGGFYILIAGHRRFGLPHSSCLYHEGSTGIQSDANKFQNFADFYKKQRDLLRELTIQTTKVTEDEYNLHMKDDWWFTAEESLQYGLIDEIVPNSWDIK